MPDTVAGTGDTTGSKTDKVPDALMELTLQRWVRQKTTKNTKKVISGRDMCYEKLGDFPGSAVVKNLPANSGDTGSSPGPGRSHTPRSN